MKNVPQQDFTGEEEVPPVDTASIDSGATPEEKEAELNETKRLLEQTIRTAQLGGWEKDFIKGTDYWSEVTRNIYGVDRDFVPTLNTAVEFFQAGEHRQRVMDTFDHAVVTGESFDIEAMVVTAQGQERWVRILGISRLRQGECVGLYGTIQDIDDRKRAEERLKAKTEQYKLAIAGTNDGIFDWDLVTNEVFLSARWKEILGYADDELTNSLETVVSLVWEEDLDRVRKYLDDYLSGKIPTYQIEYRMKHKNGSKRWILVKAAVLRDASGAPVRMAGSHSDITSRRESIEEIERLSLVAKNTNNGVIFTDPERVITWVNEGFTQMTGYLPGEVIGLRPSLLQGKDTDPATVQRIGKKLRQGKTFREVILNYRKDGSPYWNEIHVQPYYDKNGQQLGFFSIQNDITERQKAAEALALQEQTYEQILEHSMAGYWDWDIPSGNEYMSPTFKKMFGYEDHEIENRVESWQRLIFAEDLPHIMRQFDLHVESKGQEPFYDEFRYRHKDGSTVWVLCTGKVIEWDEKGAAKRMIGCHLDITERKKNEEELARSREEALQASQAKSQFLANMSHEIRTPLNGVIGFADLLMKTPLNEMQEQYCDYIYTSGNTLLNIINDILDFSKIESGKLELDPVQTDVVELVEQATDIIKYHAASKHLELLMDVPPGIPRIARLDPVRLKQILINLLSNAVKFTEQGEVEIKLQFSPGSDGRGKYHFAVRDTGIGISEDQRRTLFQAFRQADNSTTRKFGGTGLGLIISHLLAEKMGTPIQLESTPGIGSTFSFSLETDCEEKDEPGEVWTVEKSLVKKVLIIDDHAGSCRILKGYLDSWGVTCKTTGTGFSALELLPRQPFDLVLVDYRMPYINGLDTIRMIRDKLKLSPEMLPVVLLHGSSDDQQMLNQGKELGVFRSLVKPVKATELAEVIRDIGKRADADAEHGVRARISPVKPLLGGGRAPTILLVEDVALNMLLLKAMIGKILPGTQIHEATDGWDALKIVQNEGIDLIFMDLQMPILDGFEATRRIRQWEQETGQLSPLPIIALTAGALKEEQKKAYSCGMNEFLTKPIAREKLEACLRQYFS